MVTLKVVKVYLSLICIKSRVNLAHFVRRVYVNLYFITSYIFVGDKLSHYNFFIRGGVQYGFYFMLFLIV